MDAMWWRSVAVAFAVFICCWPQAASGQATNSIQQTTVASVSAMAPDIVYIDCFTELETSPFHILDIQLPQTSKEMFGSPSKQQPPTCAQACWRAGYPYIGVKGYYQCWCGKEVKALQFQKGRCMSCLGSFQYRCGKKDTIAIYKVNQVPPRASICQNERTAVAGATVTFQCLATGDEPIQFMWQLPRFNPRATASGGSLTIYDVRSSDSGEYKCTAKNPYIGMPSLRVSNATARLMVQTPPQARISVPKPFVVGQSGTLACEAFGDSPIQLSWVIGNATMTLGTLTTGRLSATYDRGATKTTLTIKNITLQDEGLIYCEATNNRIIDLSKRSDLAQFYYNPTGNGTGVYEEATSAPSAKIPDTTSQQATTNPATTPPSILEESPTPDEEIVSSGFFGLGIDSMTVIACLCGCCALFLLVMTLVVCYWQRRKVAQLDEKQHTQRLSTGHVLGSTGSYLYPCVSDSDSFENGTNTLESTLTHQNATHSEGKAVDVNNRYSINGSQLQDMYVLDEEANFNPQRLDPISTSFFERNVLGDGSGGTFFTNPAASLPGNTAYAESPQPINYSS